MFLQFLLDVVQSLRMKFRLKGKEYFRGHNVFLKVYESEAIAQCEHRVITNIRRARLSTFRVPRIFKLTQNTITGQAIAAMERIQGKPLELFIYEFILFRNDNASSIFYRLGQALRELHNLENLDVPCRNSIPCSETDLMNEIKRLVRRLHRLKFLQSNDAEFVQSDSAIDRVLMQAVNLYGEAYFNHVILSNEKFVFLDMENASYGPLYHDLATFSVSIYASVFLPETVLPKLGALRYAFLRGYFRKIIPYESIRMAELYIILYEIDKLYTHPVYLTTFRNRLFRLLKLRRYRWLINNLILGDRMLDAQPS